MKHVLLTYFIVAVANLGISLASAQEMPKPQQEHKFLEKFVGEWDSKMEASGMPGQPAMECQGVHKAKMMGPFWIVSAGNSKMMGQPMESIMQLGFDPKKKKYVGTWSDSISDHMWQYEGTLEGNTLTLNTEGPNMMSPGKMAKYRDVIEFKSPDHYTLSSTMQGDDGGWKTFMLADFKKK
ncbi:MAG: DUF1579 domain-containing protein [Bythopirellula sp.]|nr:DUF1579 domain-containing protein [Bythopirellula sp.]